MRVRTLSAALILVAGLSPKVVELLLRSKVLLALRANASVPQVCPPASGGLDISTAPYYDLFIKTWRFDYETNDCCSWMFSCFIGCPG